MSSAVKEKKDELLGQATAEAQQKQEPETPEQTENRSNAKEVAQTYQSKAADNRRIREERANDPTQAAARVSGIDRDKYDLSGYSDKEIAMSFQGGEFGDKDYARLTGKTMGGGDSDSSVEQPTQEAPTTPTTPTTPAAPTKPGGIGYELKRGEFSTDIAQNAMKDADFNVNYNTQVRGLNDAINKKSDYYRSRTDMQTLGLFGDIWNQKSFDWKAPQKPEPIETTYDTDTSF